MQKTELSEKKGTNIRCLACSHYCVLSEGQVGICGIRKNIKNELYLLVYGQAAAANIDPMEKKPLFHFLPGQKIFTIGTVGCNFACEFCQNWDISQSVKQLKKSSEIEGELESYGYKLPPEAIVDFCVKNKIKAIAFSYNEPTVFFEYAYDTAVLAKKKNIKTVFVSNGYFSKEAIENIRPYLDAINIDLKSFNEEFYMKTCKAKLKVVLDNIKLAHKLGYWIEITTLLIPDANDSEEEIGKIAAFIASVDKNIPWHVTAFHPEYKMLDKESTPLSTLEKAYNIGKKHLNYVYAGNLPAKDMESTFCHKCNELLIERRYYQVKIKALKDGKCKKCGQSIPGIFN